jgi:hypothetical protein
VTKLRSARPETYFVSIDGEEGQYWFPAADVRAWATGGAAEAADEEAEAAEEEAEAAEEEAEAAAKAPARRPAGWPPLPPRPAAAPAAPAAPPAPAPADAAGRSARAQLLDELAAMAPALLAGELASLVRKGRRALARRARGGAASGTASPERA